MVVNISFFNGGLFLNMVDINCRSISKGFVEGELLTSGEAISFLGGVDPVTGVVLDAGHDLRGVSISDKVLFIPGGKGSTVGSYVLFQLKKNGVQPRAIICLDAEPIIATGAIMADIPMVDHPDDTDLLVDGVKVSVDADNGIISVL